MHDFGIFIYRKDLRTVDNRGLIKLSETCKEIIPIFIFDPNQIDKTNKNKNYISFPVIRFLCESVKNLDDYIKNNKSKLNIFYGKPHNVLKYIFSNIKKNKEFFNSSFCLGFNNDYTEYSLTRDKLIIDICNKNKIEVIQNHDDFTLMDMELLKKDANSPYKQYGAFKKKLLDKKNKINKPINKKINFYKKEFNILKKIDVKNIHNFWINNLPKDYKPLEVGERKLALNILKNLGKFNDYNTKRDILSYQTTQLSAYLNFGLISEREFYFELKSQLSNSQLIEQIIWRDYYYCILRFIAKANSYNYHIDSRFDKIKWANTIPNKSSKVWKEWNLMLNSKTGFLIIDAAIQQIKKTGFMHNRCRMIVGVFSVKYLMINPLCNYIGLNEWFSRYLLDCSTSQNKLNTQWVSELDFPGKKFAPSDAPLSGRPMTISNEVIKKWDPECKYIKKWLPHLKDIDNKILYKWDTKYNEKIHPKPIFNAKDRYKEWVNLCKKAT
jgi:deoxyribodipyrimidine photo-lyase